MNFKVISLFPEMFTALTGAGLVSQAIENNIVNIQIINPRDFSSDKHLRIDDKPFGGSDGMLCKAEDMQKGLEVALQDVPNAKKIYLSARGKKLSDSMLREFTQNSQDIILICGRYAGIDQRFIYHNQIEEISIGDYILTGGELPVMVFIDAVSRLLPKVLGNPLSSEMDSFSNSRLEAPQFTRPQLWNSLNVPKVLTSGDHQKVKEWQDSVSLISTIERRPDLVDFNKLNAVEIKNALLILNTYSTAELNEWGICNIEEILEKLNGLKK